MERTDSFDRIIVEKDRMYVRNGPLLKMYAPKWEPDLTPHRWDAKPFSSHSIANKIARKIGGRVRMFDTLEGVIR